MYDSKYALIESDGSFDILILCFVFVLFINENTVL